MSRNCIPNTQTLFRTENVDKRLSRELLDFCLVLIRILFECHPRRLCCLTIPTTVTTVLDL